MNGDGSETKLNFRESVQAVFKPTAVRIFFLGISAGLPLLLIFSSLSLWLREAGLSKSAVTYFAWAALGYSFKFVWAPLVDLLPLPLLTKKLGRRRSWLLIAQIMTACAILGMGLTDPALGQSQLTLIAIFAVALGFSSATQDIVIDAFRIESDSKEMQAILAANYVTGYRVGMIISGAGALFLADYFGSSKEVYNYSAWLWTYAIMAGVMGLACIVTLVSPEPQFTRKQEHKFAAPDYGRFMAFFAMAAAAFVYLFFGTDVVYMAIKGATLNLFGQVFGLFVADAIKFFVAVGGCTLVGYAILKTGFVNRQMVDVTYVNPVKDFFTRYSTNLAILLLLLIGFYRVSDIVLGVISNVFYQDLGYSKTQIATVVKTWGLVATIVGGYIGGVLTVKYGVMRIMFLGGVLAAATNLLFMWLAHVGTDMTLFYFVISIDNLAAGLASAVFVAFLSGLVNLSFTAMQYAIFSSLMTLFPKLLGGYSGTIVEATSYTTFFAFTTLLGIPVLGLIWWAGRNFEFKS